MEQLISWVLMNFENLTTLVLGINVFLCALNNKWNWPVGLLGVTMYGWGSWFLWGLYADAALQLLFFCTGIFGWYYWCKGGKNKTEAPITDLSTIGWLVIIFLDVVGTLLVGELLIAKTDSVVPYLDAFTTVNSILAQFLLMTRNRSAWFLWVATNVTYLFVFEIKGLESLQMLYFAFIANAVFGYFVWTRAKNKQ